MSPLRFAEEQDVVRALDEAIRKEPTAVVDAVGSFLEHAKFQGITTLTGVGLPLRPAVLSRARLAAISAELFQLALQSRDLLLEHPELVPADFVSATDFAASLRSPHALSGLRPDGMLFDDAFALTELNVGNGLLISTAYASAVHRFLTDFSPTLSSAGLAPEGMVRSFDGLVEVLRAVTGKQAPRVALLLPLVDCTTAAPWGEKVHQQLSWAPKLLREAGLACVVVDESGLVVDAGRCRTLDGSAVDVVYLATTGLGFFDDPARLLGGDHSIYRGSHVGDAPLVLPLAALAFEKGLLPALRARALGADGGALRDVRILETEYPSSARAATYRLERERFVLKRSFRDKHTFTGVATAGRRWNWYLEQVLDNPDYIMQEYVSLPTTTMPVLIDHKHIEWIEVRVELSPFIFGGKPWGAMIRYAPDAEGLVMSPPPEGMGFGVALLV